MKRLGVRIRELREAKDISLREFAKKLRNSAAHISDIELGRRYPSPELLEKIAEVLRTPIEELKSCDERVPVEELKRISGFDPAFGFALRKLVDKKVSAKEILEWAERKREQDKGK